MASHLELQSLRQIQTIQVSTFCLQLIIEMESIIGKALLLPSLSSLRPRSPAIPSSSVMLFPDPHRERSRVVIICNLFLSKGSHRVSSVLLVSLVPISSRQACLERSSRPAYDQPGRKYLELKAHVRRWRGGSRIHFLVNTIDWPCAEQAQGCGVNFSDNWCTRARARHEGGSRSGSQRTHQARAAACRMIPDWTYEP